MIPFFLCTGSQLSDPFNLKQTRTVKNTKKDSYNCAGYALECFSWYCPVHGETYTWRYAFDSAEEAIEKTENAAQTMLEDFPTLRVIKNLKDVSSDEYAIMFRLSSDGDFHYLKRDRAGHWRHKIGASTHIDIIKTMDILSDWCNRYDGPIVLFAKKR